jgi:tripeptide aminopeptidase
MEFAKLLFEEARAIGLSDVQLSDDGIVTATLPSNIETDAPVLGLLAHMDTSPETSGKDVTVQLHENYDGKDIVLSAETVLSPEEFPELQNYISQTIITASGDTLLGADDKAGIAEILTAMEYLIQHPEISHGTIRIAFTPDEEIGRGTDHFDVDAFGADFAFTIDGGSLGELEFENFNAAWASFEITGKVIHAGSAKGIMKNSALIATELVSAFPPDDVPSKAEGYKGFYHLVGIEGDVAKTKMNILIRYFDNKEFETRKQFIVDLVNDFNIKYGEDTVKLDIRDQYYNMKAKIDPQIIEYAKAAFAVAGVDPIVVPVRGGTDGAMLSFKGLPCPNVFAGGHNFHGPYEFIPVESMEKAVYAIVSVCQTENAPEINVN